MPIVAATRITRTARIPPKTKAAVLLERLLIGAKT
jgi:hypothetical protein